MAALLSSLNIIIIIIEKSGSNINSRYRIKY